MREEVIKELGAFFTAMCQSQGSDSPVSDERRDKEKATAQILNLILDTILASEEMQGEWHTTAEIRTMLEGMKT